MSNCRLCHILGADGAANVWDKPVLESTNFVAVPSLGALVPGWVLLLPKNHYLTMGAVPVSAIAEMEEVKWGLVSLLRQAYGELCAFEHGPSGPSREVGCGVDHAHLHFVPINIDLGSAVLPLLPRGAGWSEGDLSDCRRAFESGLDYLYLEQPLGRGRIAVHKRFGSQLFRRVVASHLGIDNEYNWRDYPKIDNIVTTVRALRSVPRERPIRHVEIESVA
jgi:diadenosine tetraphosphate (Ap4A) HIT family hydrolase